MRIRRRARFIAIQALYELDLTNHSVDRVIKARIADAKLPSRGVPFVYHLVEGVLDCRQDLADMI